MNKYATFNSNANPCSPDHEIFFLLKLKAEMIGEKN